MKRIANKAIVRLILSVSFVTIGFGLFVLTTVCPAQADITADGVVLVHLQYGDGQWRLGKNGVRILPCDAPSDFKRGTAKDPFIRVLGEDGKLLYEKTIMNPRRVLYEDRNRKSQLLEKVSFNLRFAYHEGMQVFELYQTEDVKEKQGPPVVKADMREAVKQFEEKLKSGARFPCQKPLLK